MCGGFTTPARRAAADRRSAGPRASHPKKARDHFISTVSGAPKLFVIGSEDELEAMG